MTAATPVGVVVILAGDAWPPLAGILPPPHTRCMIAGGVTLSLVVGVVFTSSSPPKDPPSTEPTKIMVVAGVGVDDGVEQRVRAALVERGSLVLDAEATRTSLGSARELGLDCLTDGDAGACWRRVAALAREDAIVVVDGGSAGAIVLRLLDARADRAARTASGGAADAPALVAELLAAPVASRPAPPPPPSPTRAAPAAQPGVDLFTLGVALGAANAALMLVSGVSVVVIQQTVLDDPGASGATKATAFGAGVVLIGATALFAVGAIVGGGIAAVASLPPGEGDSAS